jgi:hypothetical protein
MAEPESQPDCPRERLPFWCRAALATGIGTVLIIILGLTVFVIFLWFVHHRHLPNWVINLVGLALVLGALLAFWRTMRFLSRRRYRFSLRAWLIGMAVLGILASRMHFVAREQQALWALWRQGGSVEYRLTYREDSVWFRWLIRYFGFDPFGKILDVDVRNDGAIQTLAEHHAEFADVENVCFFGVTDRGLEHVAKLSQLPNLACANFLSSPITDTGLKHLAGWKNLQTLMLNSCSQITDAGLAHLTDLPDLEHLALFAGRGGMGLTDAGLAHVGRMSRLQSLAVSGIPFSDSGLAQLRALRCLERLTIDSANITDAGLPCISGLNIKGLSIRNTRVTDAGGEHLEKMTQLEWLSLGGPGIGDRTLVRLQKLPKLKRLSLDSTQVTDDGLRHLQGMPALEELYLRGPVFSDAGLRDLSALPTLRRLRLAGLSVTPAAVDALRAALPECQIEVY